MSHKELEFSVALSKKTEIRIRSRTKGNLAPDAWSEEICTYGYALKNNRLTNERGTLDVYVKIADEAAWIEENVENAGTNTEILLEKTRTGYRVDVYSVY